MKRVLVVDDEHELVREYPQDRYEVTVVHSGPAALEAARLRRPDVVSCDISMPGPSGIDVLKALRRSDPNIPVVMVTGNTEVAIVQECLRAGAVAYVPKPFDLKYVEHMATLATEQDRGAANPTPAWRPRRRRAPRGTKRSDWPGAHCCRPAGCGSTPRSAAARNWDSADLTDRSAGPRARLARRPACRSRASLPPG
jgi:CheY-like chemotaxis protein